MTFMFGFVDTPGLLLDSAAVEDNIRLMAENVRKARKHLRPHLKGHKSPLLAHKQLAAGAIGIACAKLGEAEVMVQAGIRSVLITTELVGEQKIDRLVRLAPHAETIAVFDDLSAARAVSAAAVTRGVAIGALVDVNVGQNRCGVLPGQPVLELARELTKLPGLTFLGLQGYEGHIQAVQSHDERRRLCLQALDGLGLSRSLLRDHDIPVAIVTTAGTGTYGFALEHDAVTEVQPGSYLLMDSNYAQLDRSFSVAVSVLTTVISRPAAGWGIIDAGYKAISADAGAPLVKNRADLVYMPAGDEHGRIEPRDGGPLDLEVGDRLELIPSHTDTTTNLYDCFHVISGGAVDGVWPIAARGKVQ